MLNLGRSMRSTRLVGSAAALLLACGSAFGQVADDAFKAALDARQAAWNELQAAGNLNYQTVSELNRKTIVDLGVENLSIAQLQTLNTRQGLIGVNEVAGFSDRLAALADAPGKDGALAMLLQMQLASQIGQDAGALAEKLMTHPGLGEIVRTDEVGGLFGALGGYASNPANYERVAKFVLSLPDDMTMRGAMGLRSTIMGLSSAVTDETRPLHAKVLDRAIALTSKHLQGAPDNMKPRLEDSIAFYKGAFARGELMNHQMPAMDVIWASDSTVTSMDAYRGKVLILDFWATWCGPCISSFPNIKHVAEHYKGYDVAIVGVTSLQGASYNGPTGERIVTEGDPEKEYELMKEFMGHRDMVWDVVFTKQSCFNPDFGVNGIPHMAIVDPSGKVRYNALHPAGVSFEEKTRMIDELLREAGLKTPPASAGG